MLLKLSNIHKSFGEKGTRNFREVLQDVSLDINTGESLAILGPSGSGKSTLLNIIGTLDTPELGYVSYDGDPINQRSEKELSALRNREIGFVFQSHHLLPQCNVLENVLIPTLPLDKDQKNNSEQLAKELIKNVGLWEQRFDFPTTLSGGECQRVAVIRALINRPKLILADEPTGSLDHENAKSIVELLLQLKEQYQTSLVVVTHSEEIARRMDKQYRLAESKLSRIQ